MIENACGNAVAMASATDRSEVRAIFKKQTGLATTRGYRVVPVDETK